MTDYERGYRAGQEAMQEACGTVADQRGELNKRLRDEKDASGMLGIAGLFNDGAAVASGHISKDIRALPIRAPGEK